MPYQGRELGWRPTPTDPSKSNTTNKLEVDALIFQETKPDGIKSSQRGTVVAQPCSDWQAHEPNGSDSEITEPGGEGSR